MRRLALEPPQVRSRWSPALLAAAALLSILAWQVAERIAAAGLHPRYREMLAAARVLQEASRTIAAEKTARGLMQDRDLDPNRTGLIGPEMTEITTTVGDLGSKRTVTNPDFAAALVRVIDTLQLPRGAPVVLLLSGSFVGADIGAVAALEALGLEPVIVVSLSASMFGATDPEFNILDMLGHLRRHRLLRSQARIVVLGGEKGVGTGMEPKAVAHLQAAITREGALLVDERPFPRLVERLLQEVRRVLGPGKAPGLVINVGGALIALGSCPQSYELPPGLTLTPATCTEGTPGLTIALASETGSPVFHIINIRRLARELRLPFDPRPLPEPGINRAVYRASATNPTPGATR